MYKKNKRTLQPLLLSDVNDLPERTLKYLKNTWSETFRREVFCRIPEDSFQVLYDPDPSRPNVPVNVLVGLEILKDWRGWSDEELYEHFLFDLQVRYAVGCDNLGEGDFDLRTLYYFRQRLSEHALKSGENLFKVVFEQVTDQQIQKLNLNTKVQRMDSAQILSNIADLSRLELLVEAMQRLYRVLSEADQARYAEVFQPYIKESAGQYTYRIRGKEAVWQHIEQVGKVLHDLLGKLTAYQEQAIYQTVQRFFAENFKLVESQVQAKTNPEITPGCLQSLDDLEATYRIKGSRAYKGFVGNFSETCAPENPVQLITDVQVATNRTHDIALLQAALPGLQERTDLQTLVTDGGYVSPEIDETLRQSDIEQITTGLTGTLPDRQGGKQALSDFEMDLDREGNVTRAICPAGQPASVHLSASKKSFKLIFDPQTCQACTFYQADQCPIQTNKHKSLFFLTVPKERANSSQRRRRFERCKEEARALRPAVEATIFQVKHALRRGKVRVRGLFRTTCVMTCAALAVNLRRIHRYENDQQRGKYTSKKARTGFLSAFSSMLHAWHRALHLPLVRFGTCFSC
jgi:ABC-type transporter MlaC component